MMMMIGMGESANQRIRYDLYYESILREEWVNERIGSILQEESTNGYNLYYGEEWINQQLYILYLPSKQAVPIHYL